MVGSRAGIFLDSPRLKSRLNLATAISPACSFGNDQAVPVPLRDHLGQLTKADEGGCPTNQYRFYIVRMKQQPRTVGAKAQSHPIPVPGAHFCIKSQLVTPDALEMVNSQKVGVGVRIIRHPPSPAEIPDCIMSETAI